MAGQSPRKATMKDRNDKDRPDPEAPKRRLHIPTLATLSAELRTLLLNLCLMAIVLVMIPVVALQFLHTQVIIDTFAVPPGLVQRGLGPDVVANRLWDGLEAVMGEAGSSKEGLLAIPKSQRVDFSIPDSGISIDALVYYVRQFFHLYPTRISGEFICADAACLPGGMSLRIRVLREKLQVIQMPPMGDQPEAAYFHAAAARVLGVLDPFLAAAVEVQTHPLAGLAHAEQLVRQGHPDAIWAWNLIGTTRMNLGQTDLAIAAFRGALAIDPGFVIAQTNLGSALVAKGDYAGAAQVFDTVARTHPGDRFLALGRYRLDLAQGRTDAAIDQVLQAETADPGKATYLFMAAQAAYDAGDTAKATAFLQRALAVAPDDDGAVTLMNLIYQLAKDYDKSAALLENALTLSPDHVDFLSAYAQTLGLMHQFDPSLVQIDRLLVLKPGDTAARKLRASTLQALNRHPEALAQLRPLLQADQGNAELTFMQGQSLQAVGQSAAAKTAYAAAMALDPASPYGMMAKAYLQTLP